jgi:HEAT repeat protein
MKFTLIGGILLAIPCAVLAQGEEIVGNAPLPAQPKWSAGVINVVNLKSRIYWDGYEDFFFRGNDSDVNEALARYAEIKQEVHEVILLPGNGRSEQFSCNKFDYDWQLHVPTGIYRAVNKQKTTTLTVYVNQPRGTPPKDRKQIDEWVRQLDHDEFAVREKAAKELAKRGNDLKPIYKQVLKSGQLQAEGQRQVESLLGKLAGIDVGCLEIPKELRLVEAEELIAANLKKLENTDSRTRGYAVRALVRLARCSNKVVPALAETLKKDKNSYVRRCAAGGLSTMGSLAAPALEVIKAGQTDDDESIRAACNWAKAAIEKDTASWEEESKRFQAILKDIHQLKLGREAK